jgi:hypothetical protein
MNALVHYAVATSQSSKRTLLKNHQHRTQTTGSACYIFLIYGVNNLESSS